jgi:hypothetical protein
LVLREGRCDVNFSEQPPSEQWAALKYKGRKFAEVWFKPEGQPCALTFRIPRESFLIPGMDHLLTTENLLKAVAIATEDVASWRHGDVSHSDVTGSDPELRQPLPPPPEDDADLSIYVSLKPPPSVVASSESGEPETPVVRWEDLEARWRAILGVEASIENLRLSIEALQAEMVISSKKTLTTEVKVNALHADVAQWSKAKNRVHYAQPKVKEFIHRATWVMGTPERKKLEELFKNDVHPDYSFPELVKLADELENLLKDRQVLSGQGGTVYQECKTVATGIESALRTLQSNATAKADRKRRAARPKGKFFKHIRRWSGAE